MIIVTCQRPGFRRAGLAHPARAEYPDGHFTPEQMAALKREPMLAVIEVLEAPAGEAEGVGEGDAAAKRRGRA